MPNIAPALINMNRATLKIGTDNYEKSVSTARGVPTSPIGKFKGIGGNTSKVAGVADWLLNLTYAQDWKTENSLSQYALANHGLTKVVELVPETGGGTFTVTVLVVAGDFGGDADTTTTASVAWEIIDQPAYVAAA